MERTIPEELSQLVITMGNMVQKGKMKLEDFEKLSDRVIQISKRVEDLIAVQKGG